MDELQQQQPPDFFSLLQQEWDVVRRRLRGMAMISRGIVPNLLISQRMVDRVVDAARHFLADETGETMVRAQPRGTSQLGHEKMGKTGIALHSSDGLCGRAVLRSH